jgi:hypothetical protein
LIKEVCEGGYVVRHNRMMPPEGRARRGGSLAARPASGPRSRSRKPSRFGAGRRDPVWLAVSAGRTLSRLVHRSLVHHRRTVADYVRLDFAGAAFFP